MRLSIDTDRASIVVENSAGRNELPLYTPEAFALLSDIWLKTGWALKYTYGFTWLGRPVIQLPEDLVRMQELLWRTQPDVLIETGVAHGGSLVFYASLFKAMGRGRVIGVDVEIRPHNRQAIEAHLLAPLVTLIEGSSIDPDVVSRVRSSIQSGERVLVVLDSKHTKAHVEAELEAYAPLVSHGCYIVVADGNMRELADVPGGSPDWIHDNPAEAVDAFLAKDSGFEVEEARFAFNEGRVKQHMTYWPHGFLRRRPY